MKRFVASSARVDDHPQLFFEQILACVLQYRMIYHDHYSPGRVVFLPPGNILTTGMLQAGGVHSLLDDTIHSVLILGHDSRFSSSGLGILDANTYFAGMGADLDCDVELKKHISQHSSFQLVSEQSFFELHAEHLPYLRALKPVQKCLFGVIGDSCSSSQLSVLLSDLLVRFPRLAIVFGGFLSQGKTSTLTTDNERLTHVFAHKIHDTSLAHQPLRDLFGLLAHKKEMTLGGYLHSTQIRAGAEPIGYAALGLS